MPQFADRWFSQWEVERKDLEIYRVLFSIYLLLGGPVTHWGNYLGPNHFSPRASLAALFPSLPADGLLVVIESIVVLAALVLFSGLSTKWSSWVIAVGLTLLLSIDFALTGRWIDFLLPAIAMVMATCNWEGPRYEQASEPWEARYPGWSIGLCVLMGGIWMSMRGYAQWSQGWLDSSRRGLATEVFLTQLGSMRWNPSGQSANTWVPLVWQLGELVDWVSVFFYGLAIIFVFQRRICLIWLAFAVWIHVASYGLGLTGQGPMLLAYGAAVPWSRVWGLVLIPQMARQMLTAFIATLSIFFLVALIPGWDREGVAILFAAVVCLYLGLTAFFPGLAISSDLLDIDKEEWAYRIPGLRILAEWVFGPPKSPDLRRDLSNGRDQDG